MADGVTRAACAAVVMWSLAACGQEHAGPSEFVWCDDLLRPAEVSDGSSPTDSQLATARTRADRLLTSSIERQGPVIAVGGAQWLGVDRRIPITVTDDEPATLAEVADGLADGDEGLVCLRVGEIPRG